MYRYRIDNAVTYTPEDFALFRESPFACWMERLTLDNPDHGISPDTGSEPPLRDSAERQDDLADTLGAEGKDVRLIPWDEDEPGRRDATLEAMRGGADFVVNGQLAQGPLSGAANLLVRTSGYSQLGDFLYVPCDMQSGDTRHSAFRLCFLADLLYGLQGQLPPQILIVSDGDDLVPLQTDDYIHHYRAVKKRFLAAMQRFRKHRMPDPAESSHFGRWTDCAHEVLKQRLLREDSEAAETVAVEYAEPLRKVASVAGSLGATPYDLDDARPAAASGPGVTATAATHAGAGQQPGARPDLTLVEQARILKPGTYKPGPGVYRLGPPREPAPSLRGPRGGTNNGSDTSAEPVPGYNETQAPPAEDQPPRRREPVSAARPPRPAVAGHSAIDLDGSHGATSPQQLSTTGALAPVAATFAVGESHAGVGETSSRNPGRVPGPSGDTGVGHGGESEKASVERIFSNSLITSEESDD